MRANVVMLAMLVSSSAVADDAPTGFPQIPQAAPDESRREKAEEAAPISFPSSNPTFSPTTSSVLSAAFAVKSKEKLTTVTIAPLKPTTARPLWGLQFTAANDSGSNLTTFGVAYRAEWRWLLAGCYASAFSSAYDDWVQSGNTNEGALFKAFDRKLINLLPVVSVGASVSVFAIDLEKENHHMVAERSASAQLAWRFGPYVQADLTGAIGGKRPAVDQREYASIRSASATLVFLVPSLVGLDYYDPGFSEGTSLYQRGIGLGGTLEYKKCDEDGADRGLCPDGILRSLFVGAVVDLRIAKDIAPRFILGRRAFTKFTAATEQKEAAVEAGIVLAFTIKS